MAGELRLNEVATPSVPASGKHALYVGNANTILNRLIREDTSGTLWPVAEQFVCALSADYTLGNVATAQPVFNATTNGAITLPASSAYLLESEYLITNTGTTSHTWGVLYAGAATLTALDFTARGRSGITSQLTLTADSSASQSNGAGSLPTTSLVVTAASTAAAENVIISIRGVLRINGAGTFIPQVILSAATGVAATVKRGSYIKLTPIGTNTTAVLGSWS